MIRTLYLTGQNNHDWKRTSVFLAQMLEASGRFDVSITEHASSTLENAPELEPFDLLFCDYNGSDWSAGARENFVRAVEGGQGLVIYHAANNSFPSWPEYAQMLGLAWREKSGHGEFHSFRVDWDDVQHPVSRGLEAFEITDELYHRLEVTGPSFHVLASAYSDPARGGTGQREPLIGVNSYGQGRIFHTALGHVWPGDGTGGSSLIAVENAGFQESLLRGAQWAARGEGA
jgi:type 1 glutamine amidotransferase